MDERSPQTTADSPPVEHTATQDPSSPRPSSFPYLAPAQAPDEVGRLGGFRLLRLLGEGGMGVVFEAEDCRLGRRVAVKVMKPEAARHEEGRRRFLREARAAAAVEHDHVVPIHQVDEDHGTPYLVMPLLKGESLEDRLRRRHRLSAAEAVRIAREAAEGLAAAHAAGLVHRDVKPSNLWLEQSAGGGEEAFRVKVLDFGLARPVEVEEELTCVGAFMGTAGYTSPEQARGETLDGRADLFSLGCVLYRMLTGQGPFRGKTLSIILRQLETFDPPAPREVDASVPADVSDLVMRLLSKAPSGRPASAREAAETLRAIERTSSSAAAGSQADSQPPPRRRLVWWAFLVLLLVVPVSAFFLWRFLSAPLPPPPPPPVSWTPEHHGFVTPDGAQIQTEEIGQKRYYDRIVKKVGDRDVVFRLIPRTKPGEEPTFYLMENKVSNGLFKTAANDPDFRALIEEAKKQYPALKWGEWLKGGLRNGTEDLGSGNDDDPVLRVNVMEAYCFAEWLGGKEPNNASTKLPTEEQWDQAAGKNTGATEIYRDPERPLQPDDVAVNRLAHGPMPVGTAVRDVSPFGCRDMAGNGMEWTRNLTGGGFIPPSPQAVAKNPNLLVDVRGQSYSKEEPYDFNTRPDFRFFRQGDKFVGFRVVVEP